MSRQRVLFFAEAVTLAHVARPWVLARSLDPSKYEVHFAVADRYAGLFDYTGFGLHPLRSISPEAFATALARGMPLYDLNTLRNYLENDLELIDRVQPQLVVGDFRLSLAVAAPLRGVPYIALTNAHWSPRSTVAEAPLPDNPLIRVFGVGATQKIFRWLQKPIFKLHARPLNRLRAQHGLAPLGSLAEVYTHGDYTLYLDLPSLVPTRDLPPTHTYLGPVIWSPPLEPPAWWEQWPKDRPVVYVTLGSSGAAAALPGIVEALGTLKVTVLVATAGRKALKGSVARNLFVDEYLPGEAAAACSQLVVCSGGSATAYQALVHGVPVLGIASNMDQYLTQSAIARQGAGLLLRADTLKTQQVGEAARRILEEPHFARSAAELAREAAEYDPLLRFPAFLESRFPAS